MRFVYTRHARKRILEKGLSVEAIEQTVASPQAVVEEYPDDTPFPSRLVLGRDGDTPLHVVVAEDTARATLYVVTAYHPDPAEWQNGYAQRSKPS